MKLPFLLALLLLASSASFAQDLLGVWIDEAASNSSLVLKKSPSGPDAVTAEFIDRGRVYAVGSGYTQSGKLVVAFQRTDNREIGFLLFLPRNPSLADARTLNPDGTQRWRGAYRRQPAR